MIRKYNIGKIKLLSFLLFISIFFYLLNEFSVISFDFVKLFCCIVPIVIFYFVKNQYYWFHSLVIFILSFALFNLSRLYLDLFGLIDIRILSLYAWYETSEYIVIKSLLLIIISLISVVMGFYFHNNKLNNRLIKVSYKYRNIWFLVLLILLPGTLLKMYFDFSSININSYEEVYSNFNSSPLPLRVSWFLFILIVPLLTIYNENKAFIVFIIFIYFVVSAFDSLKGSRGALLKPLVFSLWYYYKFYSVRDIKIIHLTLFFLTIVIIAQLFLVYRSNIDISYDEFMLILPLIFSQQGVTFTLFPLYFDYKSSIIDDSYFYIFYPWTSTFTRFFSSHGRNLHSFDYMNNSLSLDHKLMYAVNPEAYLDGFGIGSSYVLELFLFGGLFFVLVGSFLLGWLIHSFEVKVLNNPYFLIFSILWIEHLVWVSRGSYLPEITKLLFSCFLFFYLSRNYKFYFP